MPPAVGTRYFKNNIGNRCSTGRSINVVCLGRTVNHMKESNRYLVDSKCLSRSQESSARYACDVHELNERKVCGQGSTLTTCPYRPSTVTANKRTILYIVAYRARCLKFTIWPARLKLQLLPSITLTLHRPLRAPHQAGRHDHILSTVRVGYTTLSTK